MKAYRTSGVGLAVGLAVEGAFVGAFVGSAVVGFVSKTINE